MLNDHRVDTYFRSPCGIVFVIFCGLCSCCIFMRLYVKKEGASKRENFIKRLMISF